MTPDKVKQLQQDMARLGLYTGPIDGLWGALSDKAWQALLDGYQSAQGGRKMLAWGAKVSEMFRDRVVWTAKALEMPEDGASWLMACMAWESNETFSSSIRNMAGSGAVGLIQFMPSTATALGTSSGALAAMTPEDQLNWVYRYFKPYTRRLNSLGDVYMAILWPAGIGRPDSFVLWDRSTKPTTYRQNAGLDLDKDGAITKAEAVAKVQEKLTKGLQPSSAAPLTA